jgi:hypothetical protein
MRRSGAVLFAFGLAGSVLSAGAPVSAQQFSAEVVTSNAAGKIVGQPARLYAADGNIRLEIPDLPHHYFLVDVALPAAYAVHPASKVYMDAKQSTPLARLFIFLDPEQPCRQWEVMAEVAGMLDQRGRWTCEAQGRDAVDGRDTIKFAITSPRGNSVAWVDARLKFPVKIATENGDVLTLQNIQEGPQPANDFVIPPGYRKLDVRRLFERIKQSDIWVEPPP